MECHLRGPAILNITKALKSHRFSGPYYLANAHSHLGYPTLCLELSLTVAGAILCESESHPFDQQKNGSWGTRPPCPFRLKIWTMNPLWDMLGQPLRDFQYYQYPAIGTCHGVQPESTSTPQPPLIQFWSCMYRRAPATTVQGGHTCKMQGKKLYAADLAASFLTQCGMYDAASTPPRFPMIRMLAELKNLSAWIRKQSCTTLRYITIWRIWDSHHFGRGRKEISRMTPLKA